MFGDTLFMVCDTDSPIFKSSRPLAYRSICRIVCECKSEIALSKKYLATCVRVLHKGLNSADASDYETIISYSDKIFLLDLNGVHILLNDYLQTARALLSEELTSTSTKIKAMKILASLLCYYSRYRGFKGICIGMKEKFEYSSLREVLTEVFVKFLRNY